MFSNNQVIYIEIKLRMNYENTIELFNKYNTTEIIWVNDKIEQDYLRDYLANNK